MKAEKCSIRTTTMVVTGHCAVGVGIKADCLSKDFEQEDDYLEHLAENRRRVMEREFFEGLQELADVGIVQL